MSGLKSRAFIVIRTVLGMLLLVAAALKIYGLSVSTVPPVGWFSTPAVQAVAVGWEILLSVWLLSGIILVGSWLAAIATFVVLAAISGYLGWIGQATCDCFGTIEASPWLAFAMDLTALLMLLTVGPDLSVQPKNEYEEAWQTNSVFLCFMLGAGVMLAGLIGMGIWLYGSPERVWARLQDEPLSVTPEYIDCGSGKPGETLEATVAVSNWTDEPVSINGGTSDCSCVATVGLPITIPPNESREIPLRLRVPPSKSGAFTRKVELWTDCKEKRTLYLRVGCQVR